MAVKPLRTPEKVRRHVSNLTYKGGATDAPPFFSYSQTKVSVRMPGGRLWRFISGRTAAVNEVANRAMIIIAARDHRPIRHLVHRGGAPADEAP